MDSKKTKMQSKLKLKLTTEGLLEKLPLLSPKELAERAGVDYWRIANLKRGKVTKLTDEELGRIEKVIRSLVT